MLSKIKKIVMFVVVVLLLVFGYFSLVKKAPDDTTLVSSTSSTNGQISNTGNLNQESPIGQDFLSTLLNVKSIELNDSIFSDPAFATLRDSTIVLVPDNTEGRSNPFAPIGFEKASAPPSVPVQTPTVTPSTSTTTNPGTVTTSPAPKN